MEVQKDRFQDMDDQEAHLAKFCLDQVSFCFFRNDANGRFLYVNQKACENLGYSLAEMLNMAIFDVDPTLSSDTWSGLWQEMCDMGSITFEAIHRRKDGTTFPVEITANLLEFGSNRFAISFAQDITERKRVEDALRLTQFSFDNASIGIFQTRADAQILNVNDQACRSLGYSSEELCKMTIFDIDPSLSMADWNDLWLETYQKEVFPFESVHRRKDGTTFPVEITSNWIEFKGGKYAISFVRDISTQKNDEKQKAKMEIHLRHSQRMESLGTLAGGIAHDFNNILSVICGYSELARLKCPEDPMLGKYIHQIHVAGERAKSLVQQILAFSRQGQSEKSPIDISNVVKEALSLIGATFPSTIQIRQNIKTNLGAVFADETQIHQVIMNLCTNALHSMEKEGGWLEVNLAPVTIIRQDSSNYSKMPPGKYLNLIVTDTGHGMTPDVAARIFDPYFTTKRPDEGTGLGLSTIHGIIQDHGGGIKVYSEPGVGTTFQVFFPLADTASDSSAQPARPLPSGKEFILFVDDDMPLIEIGKEMLEGLGYMVETRISPIDAIEAFRINPEKYDLILSDMTMPKMTGEKLAREIKKIRPDIPIIICTGFSTEISEEKLTEIGVNKLLMKPVTLSDLAKTVREVLDKTMEK